MYTNPECRRNGIAFKTLGLLVEDAKKRGVHAISLEATDMATAKSDSSRAADVIKNWLRNRNTLEFLGTWEQIYNSDFKVVEFDQYNNYLIL